MAKEKPPLVGEGQILKFSVGSVSMKNMRPADILPVPVIFTDYFIFIFWNGKSRLCGYCRAIAMLFGRGWVLFHIHNPWVLGLSLEACKLCAKMVSLLLASRLSFLSWKIASYIITRCISLGKMPPCVHRNVNRANNFWRKVPNQANFIPERILPCVSGNMKRACHLHIRSLTKLTFSGRMPLYVTRKLNILIFSVIMNFTELELCVNAVF